MTEDEAKTKWCPFTRVGEQASGAAENRPDGSYSCIASACMAWRPRTERAETQADSPPTGDGWVKHGLDTGRGGGVTHRQNWKREGGFCGLAGAPQ